MRVLADQNLYQVLEVPRDATLQEIEKAYRICRATYEPNSIAAYSIFSDEECSDILKRIEEAYTVLSDARLRREYDARLRREYEARPRGEGTAEPAAPRPATARPDGRQAPRTPRVRSEVELDLEEPYEPEDGVYDGTALRRYRLSRGVELEEIASATKIRESCLERLEANCYHELPAAVYVRGFLKEYARFLRLDPTRVADSYMRRLRECTGGA
jgi:curved DNA-binding protein CbpA